MTHHVNLKISHITGLNSHTSRALKLASSRSQEFASSRARYIGLTDPLFGVKYALPWGEIDVFLAFLPPFCSFLPPGGSVKPRGRVSSLV